MTRRQLEEDVYNAESEDDFDYEEDQRQAQLAGLDCAADAVFFGTGDSIHWRNIYG